MKTIFGNRKTLVSISAIMLALMLMTGGTFAWLTVGTGPGETIQTGWLDVKSEMFDLIGPDASERVIFVEPGQLYPKASTIENLGTLAAYIEIKAPVMYLTHDITGGALSSRVKVVPGMPEYDQYSASFTLKAPNTSVFNYVIYDSDCWDDFNNILIPDHILTLATTPAPIPEPIGFMRLPGIGTDPDRFFVVMPASGDYYNINGAFETLSSTTRLDYKVDVDAVFDFVKAGEDGYNQWQAAEMEVAGIVATQTLPGALEAVLGISPARYKDLQWAGDAVGGGIPTVTLRGAKAGFTPYDFLKKYYGFE